MAESQPTNSLQRRWREMTLAEQLGNAGSEVGRALNWEKNGRKEFAQKSADRALEMLDLTLSDYRWHNRLKELCRARNLTADYFYGTNEFHSSPEMLEKYFFQFAVIARKNR